MNQVVQEYELPGGVRGAVRVQIVQGDLTQEEVDAIVNAANAHLQHGGGVAGAISRKGGPEIQEESEAWVRRHGPVTHAEPAYTGAGRLPCRYVIHAVGPVWGEGQEDVKLDAAVTGALQVADRLGLASIALPAISTGIFGFPRERAARIHLAAIHRYFAGQPASGLRQVRLTLFDAEMVGVFQKALDDLAPPAA
jgi:O-acetyl-ADP-ribose deacetylase (regulator of RNase III)